MSICKMHFVAGNGWRLVPCAPLAVVLDLLFACRCVLSCCCPRANPAHLTVRFSTFIIIMIYDMCYYCSLCGGGLVGALWLLQVFFIAPGRESNWRLYLFDLLFAYCCALTCCCPRANPTYLTVRFLYFHIYIAGRRQLAFS